MIVLTRRNDNFVKHHHQQSPEECQIWGKYEPKATKINLCKIISGQKGTNMVDMRIVGSEVDDE